MRKLSMLTSSQKGERDRIIDQLYTSFARDRGINAEAWKQLSTRAGWTQEIGESKIVEIHDRRKMGSGFIVKGNFDDALRDAASICGTLFQEFLLATARRLSIKAIDKVFVVDGNGAGQTDGLAIAGQIGNNKSLAFTSSTKTQATSSSDDDAGGFVTGLEVVSNASSSAETVDLPNGRSLQVKRDANKPPIVHIVVYDNKDDAENHSMARGFYLGPGLEGEQDEFLLIIPTSDKDEVYLVFERHIAFSLCLIGGTGVGKRCVLCVFCGSSSLFFFFLFLARHAMYSAAIRACTRMATWQTTRHWPISLSRSRRKTRVAPAPPYPAVCFGSALARTL
jgi:hypothetical protein